jgi:hypothetical protein
MPQSNSFWNNNAIQFPRLLCELVATQSIDLALVAQSMDCELADIQALLDRANEAWESAKQLKRNDTSIIDVKHWNKYKDSDADAATHQIEIIDQRETHGQTYITVGALEGGLDDMLSVTIEVDTNPLTGIEDVPCAHVHFDGDALAMKLFKIGDKIIVRPEAEVSITIFQTLINGIHEEMWSIE